MNESQLKEIEKIGNILLEGVDEINRAYTQLEMGLYIPYVREELDKIQLKEMAESDELTFAEYTAYATVRMVINNMHYVLGEDNGLAIEPLLRATKSLYKYTNEQLNFCRIHLGLSKEEFQAVEPLTNAYYHLAEFEHTLTLKGS